MSANDIMRQMRDSHIPPYALTTNFDKSGLNDLKTRITSPTFINSASPVNFYLQAASADKSNMRRVCVACGLVAKGIVLQKQHPVIHVNLAGLLREIRFSEMEREARNYNPVMECLGRGGYVAIPDFLEFSDVEQKYGYHAVQLVADHLMEHVGRGGGLILGVSDIPLIDAAQFGSAFAAMLQDNFETYRIA